MCFKGCFIVLVRKPWEFLIWEPGELIQIHIGMLSVNCTQFSRKMDVSGLP